MSEKKIEKTESTPKKGSSKMPLKLVYLGVPMIEKGKDGQVLFQIKYGQIFNNGLPKEVEDRATEDKDFAKMLVEFKDVGRVMNELSKHESNLSLVKKRVRDKYEAGKKRRV